MGLRIAGIMAALVAVLALPAPALARQATAMADWFEHFKQTASDAELYRFLYALPKGGDLHNHLSGAGLSEWWWALALDEKTNGGYRYYTKVRINNCGYGRNQFGRSPYLLLFVNVQESSYQQLPACEKSEYKALSALTATERAAWLNSIRLDKDYEGRDEFFQTHWQRLHELGANPYIQAELMFKNMQAFGAEGVVYLELQSGAFGFIDTAGQPIAADAVADIYRERLARRDALATGVLVKLQHAILRFTPDAEDSLRMVYTFVDRHRDLYVGVNMVGREDNDKGYPLRFLPVLRALRQQIPAVNLAIHAGEVDEPNSHIRDTLLLGASRIGHGVNLISDPETLLLMRNSRYLVEINLVSNLLLEYVGEYTQHPFPEYLRMGIPVALSTDDRGMWDSTMTDEYFTAVKHFNLSWAELTQLGHNSLYYSFTNETDKALLLSAYSKRLQRFEKALLNNGMAALADTEVVAYQHACRQFGLCGYDPR